MRMLFKALILSSAAGVKIRERENIRRLCGTPGAPRSCFRAPSPVKRRASWRPLRHTQRAPQVTCRERPQRSDWAPSSVMSLSEAAPPWQLESVRHGSYAPWDRAWDAVPDPADTRRVESTSAIACGTARWVDPSDLYISMILARRSALKLRADSQNWIGESFLYAIRSP